MSISNGDCFSKVTLVLTELMAKRELLESLADKVKRDHLETKETLVNKAHREMVEPRVF